MKGRQRHGGQVDGPYLALHQHGDVYKHVVQLFDAALQADDVLVSGFDLTQGLFGDAGVHDLRWANRGGKYRRTTGAPEAKAKQTKGTHSHTAHITYPCSEDRRIAALQHLLQFFVRRCFPS